MSFTPGFKKGQLPVWLPVIQRVGEEAINPRYQPQLLCCLALYARGTAYQTENPAGPVWQGHGGTESWGTLFCLFVLIKIY